MVAVLVGMIVCVALAAGVLALVIIPAHREGREMLTAKGYEMLERADDIRAPKWFPGQSEPAKRDTVDANN